MKKKELVRQLNYVAATTRTVSRRPYTKDFIIEGLQ